MKYKFLYIDEPLSVDGMGAISVLALVSAFRLFHGEYAAFLKELHLRTPFGFGAGSPAGRRL